MAALTRSICRSVKFSSNFRPLSNSKVYASSAVGSADEVTHTGQVWEKDDYRRVRFMDKQKMVNKDFAIDLIAADPVVVVNARSIWSNSGGALGHPKVYINLDKPDIGVCDYSGRKFIQKQFYDAAKHGPFITYEQYLDEVAPKK